MLLGCGHLADVGAQSPQPVDAANDYPTAHAIDETTLITVTG